MAPPLLAAACDLCGAGLLCLREHRGRRSATCPGCGEQWFLDVVLTSVAQFEAAEAEEERLRASIDVADPHPLIALVMEAS